MLPCPAESTKISRLIQRGCSGLYLSASPKSTAPISAQPSGSPRWPDCEACTASMHKPRAWFAASERILTFRLMEKEGRFLISGLQIEDANLYMAEHLRSTMYFPLLSYWRL